MQEQERKREKEKKKHKEIYSKVGESILQRKRELSLFSLSKTCVLKCKSTCTGGDLWLSLQGRNTARWKKVQVRIKSTFFYW